MKKLFSDAKERIKGFFRKSDNGDKKLTYKNKKEIRQRRAGKAKQWLSGAWQSVIKFFSKYKIALTAAGLVIIVAAVTIILAPSKNGLNANTYAHTSPTESAGSPSASPILTESPTAEPTEAPTEEPTETPDVSAGSSSSSQHKIPDNTKEPELVEPTPTPVPDVVLRRQHNDIIIDVQLRLMELWYMDKDEPTDYFGSITEGAIKLFQRRSELEVTGRLDPTTYKLLMSSEAKVYMTMLGDEGSDVVYIQGRLYELGYLEHVEYENGVFDEATRDAVKEFQAANDLSSDGKVGKLTKEALYNPDAVGKGYKIGDTGDEIRIYQERLMELGYLTTEPDGVYGKDTQNAVKRFQVQNDLLEDGNLGPTTRQVLMSDDAVGNALCYGMSGIDVQNVQQRLYELNYLRAKDINGYFTSLTEKAVKLFQKNAGVLSDGKVGRNTMNLLFSDDAPRSASPVSEGGNGGGNGGGDDDGGGDDAAARIENFIRIARSKLGSRYVRGGKGPNVFDCSGFVYWCLNKAGVKQGYLTSAMWARCTKYQRNNNFDKIKRGDVIVYDGHVAISLGNGMAIDASQSKGRVIERPHNSSYWRSVFICSFRIFR